MSLEDHSAPEAQVAAILGVDRVLRVDLVSVVHFHTLGEALSAECYPIQG